MSLLDYSPSQIGEIQNFPNSEFRIPNLSQPGCISLIRETLYFVFQDNFILSNQTKKYLIYYFFGFLYFSVNNFLDLWITITNSKT